MGQVSELVGSMCFGLADIITDGIAYARMDGDVAFPNDGYKAAYTAILCFGVVTTALSLAYRLQNVRIMREHVHKLDKSFTRPKGRQIVATIVTRQCILRVLTNRSRSENQRPKRL